jgi:hypothetical protein
MIKIARKTKKQFVEAGVFFTGGDYQIYARNGMGMRLISLEEKEALEIAADILSTYRKKTVPPLVKTDLMNKETPQ